jgi:hypothetical protein
MFVVEPVGDDHPQRYDRERFCSQEQVSVHWLQQPAKAGEPLVIQCVAHVHQYGVHACSRYIETKFFISIKYGRLI